MAVEASSFLSAMLVSLLLAAAPSPQAPLPVREPPELHDLCTDGMVTEPYDGEDDAVPVAQTVDGGCQVPLEPISA